MTATAKLKVAAVLVVLLAYVYLMMFFRTFYLKSKRLDAVMEMALETEKQLLNVHNIDQKLAARITQVEKLYEDY